jgi:hypothetical protein
MSVSVGPGFICTLSGLTECKSDSESSDPDHEPVFDPFLILVSLFHT